MKKFSYLILGLAALAMAACSNDDLLEPAEGTYQLTVNLPKDMATRAIGDEITAPQTLHYTVFTSDGQYVDAGTQSFGGQTSTTVNLPLVKGNSYQIAFFSQSTSSESVYDYDEQSAEVSVNYDAMTYGEGVDADAYDCFSILYNVGKVEGALSGTVTLTRPVAQINWGTSDLKSAAVAQVFGEGAANIRTTLKATVPSTFNILTSEYDDIDEVTFPTEANALPNTEEDFPIAGYYYLAMQYVLAEESMTSNLTLTVSNSDASSTVDPIEIEVSNAPLKANYRTNIYGNLLTDQASFNVTLSSTWGAPSHDIVDGAVVTFKPDGTVYCETPNLPDGVTEEMMEKPEVGAVAINADGEPVFIQPTGAALKNAMAEYSEIYLAPNSVITTTSHAMVVPQSGVTIHGNGATITGQEHDFALQTNYAAGSVVNLTINNLNGTKVWNGPTTDCIINVTLTNCTHDGTGPLDSNSLIMTRGADLSLGTVNLNLQNCHVQNTQVGIHSTYPGTMVFNNCTFNEVGIPINIAKKSTPEANITVSNCVFTECGIEPNSTTNNAWNYAAPVRVVDNEGPSNSITLLIEGCTFTNTLSEMQILLYDYRTGKTSYPVSYKVTGCTPADPTVSTITSPIIPKP